MYCRLYKSVGDYDVLQGVFGGKLSTKDITEQAMAKEARGEYKSAKADYEQVEVQLINLHISNSIGPSGVSKA